MSQRTNNDFSTRRRTCWLLLGGLVCCLQAHGQIFVRESTWGLIEPPEVAFAGLVELVSALLLLQLAMLLFCAFLMRRKWRLAKKVPSLERNLDHLTARKELRQRITKGSKPLLWMTYILAPLTGLAGIFLGSPFMLGPIDLALIMALTAMMVLVIGALTLSRIKQMVQWVP